jgi:hypothetical protein
MRVRHELPTVLTTGGFCRVLRSSNALYVVAALITLAIARHPKQVMA